MDCQKIKGIIPKYFNHTASEEEIKLIEEHLCICHDCRSSLGQLMDELTIPEETKPIETAQASEVEYVPAEDKEIPFQPSVENTPEPPAKKSRPLKLEPEEIAPEPAENIESVVAESLDEFRPEESEVKRSKFIPEETSRKDEEYSLDKLPLGKDKSGIFEYVVLFAGIVIFAVFVYLVLKGRIS